MSGSSRFQAHYENYRVRSGSELERVQRRVREDQFYRSGPEEQQDGRSATAALGLIVFGLGLFITCMVDSDVGLAILDLLSILR